MSEPTREQTRAAARCDAAAVEVRNAAQAMREAHTAYLRAFGRAPTDGPVLQAYNAYRVAARRHTNAEDEYNAAWQQWGAATRAARQANERCTECHHRYNQHQTTGGCLMADTKTAIR